MKIYITNEPQHRLRNSLSNINTFAIIDVDKLVKSINLDLTKIHNIFLINSEIEKCFTNACKSKKYKGIIYINSQLNDDIFTNLIKLTSKYPSITDLILMDDYDTPKLQKYYHYVEEIMYFSTFKRVKILECKPLLINNE